MQLQPSESTTNCPFCGAPAGADDVVYRHSLDDPLRVAECAACNHVISVESHAW